MRIHRITLLSFVFTLSLLASACAPLSAAGPQTVQNEPAAKITAPPAVVSKAPASAAIQARVERTLDGLPLYFVENRGQADAHVAFYVPGKDNTIYFTPQGVTFALSAPLTRTSAADAPPLIGAAGLPGREAKNPVPQDAQRWAVKLDFVGANPNVQPLGENKTQATFSYFKGQPDKWRAGLPSYAQVRYPDLWPGIDLAYSGQANQLKYEFVVQPGADPAQIQLAYRGASAVNLTGEGQLEVTTPLGGFRDAAPVAYQVKDGQRVPVAMSYTLNLSSVAGDTGYSFHLGRYDASLPLVMDPAVLVYAGYIGGAGADYGYGIAVDNAGNAYVTGQTDSDQTTFPVTVGPDLTYDGSDDDAFVAKVTATGTALLYAGYIGGAGEDQGNGIAVDSAGNAYVVGQTYSDQATFPVTVGSDLTHSGGEDAFVAKVNVAGTALVYAGFIGGSQWTEGRGIAVDSADNAYVTGNTNGPQSDFQVKVGPDLTYNGGFWDGFVAKVNAAGTALVYAGFIGGSGGDAGNGIAVDGAGNAYVTGLTSSNQTTFPVKGGPDLTFNGDYLDAFVAKVNAAGTALVYAGYIGGAGYDRGTGIAVDSADNAYVTGVTTSDQTTFPVTVGPDLTYNGGEDAFVAKVNAAGTALVYAGYIGGSGGDAGNGIALDGAGNAYVTGQAVSDQTTFPVTVGPDLTYNGGVYGDAFVAKVNTAGTALLYAGYVGGASDDGGNGIAVDGAGNAYITGQTSSDPDTFPVTVGPDLTFNGGNGGAYGDAFVAKVSVPTILNVDAYVKSTTLVGALAAGVAAIPVQFSNNGATIATSAMLTATLGSGLTYLSNTSGFTPTVAGNTITWHLPNLSFMYPGQFSFALAVPSAPFGTRYPITLCLTSAGPEDNASDNLVNLQVMIARQIFLPLIHTGVQ